MATKDKMQTTAGSWALLGSIFPSLLEPRDTSIICPASNNGVVGIKSTVGLTSRGGVIPISESMDTVGSFGRTFADAVHGLNAIVGQDDGDAATCTPSRPPVMDFSKCLNNKASLTWPSSGHP